MPTNNPLQGRLNIVGLFTISSPLRGSLAADLSPPLHPIEKKFRPSSALLTQIESERSDYQLVSFVRNSATRSSARAMLLRRAELHGA